MDGLSVQALLNFDRRKKNMKNDVKHETVTEAMISHRKARERAFDTEKWMAAMWHIKDGKVVLDRTTYKFPDGDLSTAIDLLKEQCDKRQNKEDLLSDEILPMANFCKSRVDEIIVPCEAVEMPCTEDEQILDNHLPNTSGPEAK